MAMCHAVVFCVGRWMCYTFLAYRVWYLLMPLVGRVPNTSRLNCMLQAMVQWHPVVQQVLWTSDLMNKYLIVLEIIFCMQNLSSTYFECISICLLLGTLLYTYTYLLSSSCSWHISQTVVWLWFMLVSGTADVAGADRVEWVITVDRAIHDGRAEHSDQRILGWQSLRHDRRSPRQRPVSFHHR